MPLGLITQVLGRKLLQIYESARSAGNMLAMAIVTLAMFGMLFALGYAVRYILEIRQIDC